MNLSSQEQQNLSSYETPQQLAVYDTERLQPVERQIFKEVFSGTPLRVLDLGCGTGRTTVHLKQLGHDVVGVDLSSAMINRAREKHPDIDFRVMNATELEFTDASFDAALFSFNGLDCIYPEAKRWQAVAEVRRVLRPAGRFVLSSHNSFAWPTNRYVLFWWALNIVTGKIFTPFRLEYKSFRQGAKFIYFMRRPRRQIRDMVKRGFAFRDIFSKLDHPFLEGTKNLFLISLFDSWPYYLFEKK